MRKLNTLSFYAASTPLAMLVLLSGCVVAPLQTPSPRPAPPVVYTTPAPNPAYEQVRSCRADTQRAHAEVLDYYERARQAGRIDPAEAQRFAGMDAQLRNLRAQLARDGMTLSECQYVGGEINRMRDEVARMSRYDPAAVRCTAENRQAHHDTLVLYENARQAGRISPAEAQRFNAIQQRLRLLSGDVARDGLSLQDCQRIGASLAREREEVLRMSRTESPIRRCMADNQRAHDAVYTTYNDAVRSGRINPRESQQFAAIDQRLRGLQNDIRREPVTMDDCLRLGSAIARERSVVDRMMVR